MTDIDPRRSAILTIDLQNDFIHPDGAYGRAGYSSEALASVPGRVKPVIDALRRKGGTFISAQFTLVPGPEGEPLIAPRLKSMRPFLGKGDFTPGEFGHSLVDELKPADYTIECVAYSAFHQTRLEYLLDTLEIRHLVVAGIVTNGGVASTLRDAQMRDIETAVLTDGCAAVLQAVHDATLTSLSGVTHQRTCAEAIAMLQAM